MASAATTYTNIELSTEDTAVTEVTLTYRTPQCRPPRWRALLAPHMKRREIRALAKEGTTAIWQACLDHGVFNVRVAPRPLFPMENPFGW